VCEQKCVAVFECIFVRVCVWWFEWLCVNVCELQLVEMGIASFDTSIPLASDGFNHLL